MVAVRNLTRQRTPRFKFATIAEAILGKKYELSLVLCGNSLSRGLNKKYRDKDKPANVLSFPLTKTSGEIFIGLAVVVREAKRDHVSIRERVGMLFIHGCCHLKGLSHGRTMDTIEQALTKRFL